MRLGTNAMVSVWFGVVMIILLMSGVIAFTFTDFMIDSLYGGKRTFFIVLLLAYSFYRSIRIYQVVKQSRSEE